LSKPADLLRRGLAVLQEKGYNNQYPVIHRPPSGQDNGGACFTVQFMPCVPMVEDVAKSESQRSWLSQLTIDSLDMLQPGDVLIVDLSAKVNGPIVGTSFLYVLKATHGGGLVCSGSIRDLDGLAQIDMPGYFRAGRSNPAS